MYDFIVNYESINNALALLTEAVKSIATNIVPAVRDTEVEWMKRKSPEQI